MSHNLFQKRYYTTTAQDIEKNMSEHNETNSDAGSDASHGTIINLADKNNEPNEDSGLANSITASVTSNVASLNIDSDLELTDERSDSGKGYSPRSDDDDLKAKYVLNEDAALAARQAFEDEVTDLAEPNPGLICPLSKQVMTDPVRTSNGNTFDRAAIQQWINDHAEQRILDPINQEIINGELRPARDTAREIENFIEQHPHTAEAIYIRTFRATIQTRIFQTNRFASQPSRLNCQSVRLIRIR